MISLTAIADLILRGSDGGGRDSERDAGGAAEKPSEERGRSDSWNKGFGIEKRAGSGMGRPGGAGDRDYHAGRGELPKVPAQAEAGAREEEGSGFDAEKSTKK